MWCQVESSFVALQHGEDSQRAMMDKAWEHLAPHVEHMEARGRLEAAVGSARQGGERPLGSLVAEAARSGGLPRRATNV